MKDSVPWFNRIITKRVFTNFKFHRIVIFIFITYRILTSLTKLNIHLIKFLIQKLLKNINKKRKYIYYFDEHYCDQKHKKNFSNLIKTE